ncbi:MAG: hypothetical protein HC895_23605 [Leptolyngbyaceae cyanobacterium SM1_3_5]|nr:hypothetical protein [Leptolyngbyaceae cyanobacterium SM1_3_5]
MEQVTLTGLRFGESILPPTANDRDRIAVEAVEVSFNLWNLLWTRRLGLDITLLRPDIFVDQTPDGRWISTQVATQDEQGIIKTELDRIQFRQATLTLEPSPAVSAEANEPGANARPIVLQNVNGLATLQNENQNIFFEADGAIASGGNLTLKAKPIARSIALASAFRAKTCRLPMSAPSCPCQFAFRPDRSAAT